MFVVAGYKYLGRKEETATNENSSIFISEKPNTIWAIIFVALLSPFLLSIIFYTGVENIFNDKYFSSIPLIIFLALWNLGRNVLLKYSTVLFLVAILVGCYYFSVCGVRFTRDVLKHKYFHVSFHYKNSKIETNNSLILVGTSDKDIFLFCVPDSSVIVYEKKSVDSLTYYIK